MRKGCLGGFSDSPCASYLLINFIYRNGSIATSRIPTLAAAGGCMVTRTASLFAFRKQGRALVTQDMIPELGEAFRDIFGGDIIWR